MQVDILKDLVTMIDKSNLNVFEYKTDSVSIKFLKKDNFTQEGISEEIACTLSEEIENEVNESIVFSEFVATVRLVDKGNLKPYVSINDTVCKGYKLCSLEYLNLSIDILSPIDGIINNIYVDDKSFVEYGTKMFSILKK